VALVAASFLVVGIAPAHAVAPTPNSVYASAVTVGSTSSLGEFSTATATVLKASPTSVERLSISSSPFMQAAALIQTTALNSLLTVGTTSTQGTSKYTTASPVRIAALEQTCTGAWSTTLTITELTRTAGEVSSLAADWSVTCLLGTAGPVRNRAVGSLRFNTGAGYVLVGADGPGWKPPAALPSDRTESVDIPIAALGGSVTISAVALDKAQFTDSTLTGETCTAAPISPGSGCVVTVLVDPVDTTSATQSTIVVDLTMADGRVSRVVRTVPLRGPLVAPTPRPYPIAGGLSVAFLPGAVSTDSIAVQRRPVGGGAWTTLGTVGQASALGSGYWHLVDASAAAGASYEYQTQVTTADGRFTSAFSPVAVGTRPAVDLVPTTRTRVAERDRTAAPSTAPDVLDTDAGVTAAAQAMNSLGTDVFITDGTGGSAGRVSLSLFPGPGTYDAQGAIGGSITMHSSVCFAGAGSQYVVRDVLYDEQGLLLGIDVSLRLRCPGPVDAEVRFRTGGGIAIPVLSPADPTYVSDPAPATTSQDLTLTNTGPDPVTIGAVALSGAGAAQWHVTPCVTTGLAAGASCTIPTTYDGTTDPSSTTAAITVAAADAGVPVPVSAQLSGRTSGPASAPEPPGAMIDPGRIVVDWIPPSSDGGRPIQAYAVERSADGGATWTTVRNDLPPVAGLNRFVDESQPHGDLRYRVHALTDRGASSHDGDLSAAVTPTVDPSPAIAVGSRSEILGAQPWGLYLAGPYGTQVPIPLDVDGHEHESPTATADGRAVLYSRATTAGTGQFDFDVYRLSLTPGSTPMRLTDGPGIKVDAETSPDHTRIAFTRTLVGPTSDVTAVCVVPAAGAVGGAPTCLTGFSHASWLSPTVLVAADDRSLTAPLVQIPVTATGFGTPTRFAVTGSTPDPLAGAVDPTVSPGGTLVAFVDHSGLPAIYAYACDCVSVPAINGPAAGALVWAAPRWINDNEPMWTGFDPQTGAFVGSFDPSSTQNYQAELSGIPLPDTTSPVVGGVTTAYVRPGGTVGIAVTDVGSPKGGVQLSCSVDGGTAMPCSSGLPTTGIPAGHHTLHVVATDVSGNVSAPKDAPFTVDGTVPTTATTALPSYSLTSAATATFHAADALSPIVYDVRWRTWPPGQTAPNGWAGTAVGLTTTSKAFSLSTGRICVQVRARDLAGNVGAWGAETCSTRAIDDRALRTLDRGWTRVSGSAYFSRTATQAAKSGLRLVSLTGLSASRFVVVATACPTCGTVGIYQAGVRVGVLNLRASTTTLSKVFVLSATRYRYSQLEIRTTSSGLVRIDAVIPVR
jgi:hypothetical protein